jgi:transcriptional regulator with XRE-family HTH domain
MVRKRPLPATQAKSDALVSDMGRIIRLTREQVGMSQAELANKIQRRQASISDIENGKTGMDVATLIQIAHALEVPLSSLVPKWIRKILQPEDLQPDEEELLIQARRLSQDQRRSLIVQVRALAAVDQVKGHQWLSDQPEQEPKSLRANSTCSRRRVRKRTK